MPDAGSIPGTFRMFLAQTPPHCSKRTWNTSCIPAIAFMEGIWLAARDSTPPSPNQDAKTLGLRRWGQDAGVRSCINSFLSREQQQEQQQGNRGLPPVVPCPRCSVVLPPGNSSVAKPLPMQAFELGWSTLGVGMRSAIPLLSGAVHECAKLTADG